MSESRELSDFLKSLPAAGTLEGKNLVVTDSAGAISKAGVSSLLKMNCKTSGNSIAESMGIWLIIAYSKSNVDKNLIGIYIRCTGGEKAGTTFQVLASSGLTEIHNEYGTVVVSGANDIVYHALLFPIAVV